MRKTALMLAVCSVAALSGCASIVSKSQYNVAVNSVPEGADFLIKDKGGRKVHSGRTPQTVSLSSDAGFFQGQTYQIDLSKEGHTSTTTMLDSSINGWYWGNIIFGGLVGMLIVDPATGAMWKLDDHVSQTLYPLQPSATASPVTAQ
ncbi:MAG: hypothetical protein AABY68_11805 [Pseudomonadota bacterium]